MKTTRIIETQLGESLQGIIEKEKIDLNDPTLYFLLPDIPAVIQAENLFFRENGLWGERLLTFGKLSSLSNLKAGNRLNVISRLGRHFLMEEIVEELSDDFKYYKKKHHIKGFSDSLLTLLAELKHAKIAPAYLLSIAKRLRGGELKDKLKDLATIFESYNIKLGSENLVDDIDKLILLSERVLDGGLSKILPDAKRFNVFGFYDFTTSQLEVLKSLDMAGFELLIFIPTIEGSIRKRSIMSTKVEGRFGKVDIEKKGVDPKGNCLIEIHSFPTFKEEAEFAAREIKRLFIDESVKPDDIAIITRTLIHKDKFIIGECERFGIPYSVSTHMSLKTTYLGQFVLTLLRVKSSGFEKRHFLNLLRSPCLHAFFNQEDMYNFVSHLDCKSREWRNIRGPKPWLELLNKTSEGESKSFHSLKKLINIIDNNFRSLNLEDLSHDLANVMDELLVFESIKVLSRNSAAYFSSWENFCNFSKELKYISKFRFGKMKVEDVGAFITFLQELWVEEKFSFSSPRSLEKVQILDAYSARGTSFQIVFILDVGEKSFPLQVYKDPILKNDERVQINDFLGTHSLNEENFHEELEEFLFDLITSSARKRLFVTYSFRDERERRRLPSYLIEDLKERFGIETSRHSFHDGYRNPENILTKTDFSRFLYDKYSEDGFELGRYKDYLPGNSRYLFKGIEAERKRLEISGSYSEFEGKISQTEYLPRYTEFSPTQLETYGDCPFRYFARYILGLEMEEQVEDDVSRLTLGDFYHKFLKSFFLSFAQEDSKKVDLRGVGVEKLIEKMELILDEEGFESEFNWLSEGMVKVVKKRIRERLLPQFIISETNRIREWNEAGFFPSVFEEWVKFSIGEIKLKGVIDRVDVRHPYGLIVDYKLGPSSKLKFFDYHNLQLPLYLSAIKAMGLKPFGGYFRFLERPEYEDGEVETDKTCIEELTKSAEEQVRVYVDLMKNGFFPPIIKEKKAGFDKEEIELRKDQYGPCGWCEFSDLCRVRGGAFRRL